MGGAEGGCGGGDIYRRAVVGCSLAGCSSRRSALCLGGGQRPNDGRSSAGGEARGVRLAELPKMAEFRLTLLQKKPSANYVLPPSHNTRDFEFLFALFDHSSYLKKFV
jgi:hypothetical protein